MSTEVTTTSINHYKYRRPTPRNVRIERPNRDYCIMGKNSFTPGPPSDLWRVRRSQLTFPSTKQITPGHWRSACASTRQNHELRLEQEEDSEKEGNLRRPAMHFAAPNHCHYKNVLITAFSPSVSST